MDSCDRRVRAYKNGKTMEECKAIAESLIPQFKENIHNIVSQMQSAKCSTFIKYANRFLQRLKPS